MREAMRSIKHQRQFTDSFSVFLRYWPCIRFIYRYLNSNNQQEDCTMTMEDLIEERERLLKQRMDILQATLRPVQESDLDDAARTELQLQVSEALDDAFFNLLTPIETDLDDMQRRVAIRAVSSDLAALRARQI